MDEQARQISLRKLYKSGDYINWTIKNGTYGGLIADLSYSEEDIQTLRSAKGKIKLVRDKLENPYPPEVEPVTQTSFPFFEYDYSLGAILWDLHALNLPFTDVFSWENWIEGAELCAQHDVNLVRFFYASSEDKGFPYIMPFAKKGGRFDLLDSDCEGYEEIYRRLNEFWKRGIATMICFASGVKDLAGRFDNCAWNGKNNVNGTTLRAKDFMKHLPTRKVLNRLVRHLEQERGWSEKPVIYEPINEHTAGNALMKDFNVQFIKNALNAGVYMNAIAIEYWNSSKCWELSLEYPVVMPHHGCNHIEAVKRCHKGELQKYFMEAPVMFMLDADGQVGSDWGSKGVGLVGVRWSPNYRRYAPEHIGLSFILDALRSGSGLIWFDASAYYKNENGNAPNYADWKHANVVGLSAREVVAWLEWYHAKRKEYHEKFNMPLPKEDFEVDPELFESADGTPLATLKVIRQSARKLFGE